MTPVVHREGGFVFFFYSNEGNPPEPIHIHVRRAESVAKIWIEPGVTLEESYEFNSRELRSILDIVTARKEFFVRCWHEHFD